MPRRAGTYSKLKLDVPNYRELRADAERAVKDELGTLARPDDRVERAAEIIRQADAEIALHLPERDQMVASLWFHEHVLGLSKVMGVYPTAYREVLSKALYDDANAPLPSDDVSLEDLTRIAQEQGVPRVENAAEKLPAVARVVAEARTRRTTAVPFMQDAALALSEEPYGWEGERIAEHAGVAVKLIWQHWAAARKRRGD
ncbi:hypothetical protein ABZ468_08205 [Streptomyces sp. NPDC005708]|uniref:hypothetical protein n=1 Tax=Streptomyces sp. NPDC005708 TaxID=3154564 RepID=UPI0033CFAFC6